MRGNERNGEPTECILPSKELLDLRSSGLIHKLQSPVVILERNHDRSDCAGPNDRRQTCQSLRTVSKAVLFNVETSSVTAQTFIAVVLSCRSNEPFLNNLESCNRDQIDLRMIDDHAKD